MRSKRFLSVTALMAVGLLLIGGIAVADELNNQIDASLDATREIVNLAPGGATSTVTLKLQPNVGSAPDGDSGCNIDSGESLVLAATSSNTGVATVSPTVTFNNCNERTITVTSVASGSADITFTISSNNTGGGTYDLTGGNFTVVVSSPNTPPEVSVTGVTHGATYEIGSVPAAACSVSDAEDTGESATAVLTGTLSHGLGSQTATCSYTDGGGLSDSDSATYTIVDTGDPTIDGAITSGTLGSNNWYTSFPTVTFTCADTGGSGIQSCVADGETSNTKTLSSDGADQSVGGTATDWAGNTETDTVSDIDVDTTDPTDIAFSSTLSGTYFFGEVPGAPTCTASDATSGLDDCDVTGYSTAIGAHTLTATATDNAGNDSTSTASYTVVPWTKTGFYSPVDMNNVVNLVKGGSTVPLKFELFATSEITDTSAITGLKVQSINCSSLSSTADAIEQTSTGGTSLRYDSTAGQFIQNWKTPTGAGCYKVYATTADGGTVGPAFFKTK